MQVIQWSGEEIPVECEAKVTEHLMSSSAEKIIIRGVLAGSKASEMYAVCPNTK